MKKLFCILNIFILLFLCCCEPNSAQTSIEISPSSTVTATATPVPTATPTPKPTPTPVPTPMVTPYDISSNYTGDYVIKVNRLTNRVFIYGRDEEGLFTNLVNVFICSVGTGPGSNETPLGVFYTSDKYVWRSLYGGTYGQYATRFFGAYLFHSVPYTSQRKDALKSEEYNKLGGAASQGCVRLTVEDAKWIYDNCRKRTLVFVYESDSPEPDIDPIPKMDLTDARCCWDPTDPDKSNPWSE